MYMLFSHASPHTYQRQAYKRGSDPLKYGNEALMQPLGIRPNGNGAAVGLPTEAQFSTEEDSPEPHDALLMSH